LTARLFADWFYVEGLLSGEEGKAALWKFSAVKKSRARGGWSNVVGLKSSDWAALYLGKTRRIASTDSQAIRAKLLSQLRTF